MIRKEYSAGAVKFSFWFLEFKKVCQLLMQGRSLEEIQTLNKNENIFEARTPARGVQIFRTVSARIKTLDPSVYPIFLNGDLATQKQIALIAALAQDTLFFDFVYHVLREKMLIGSNEYEDSDTRIFFKNIQEQDEKAAGWTDETVKRLGASYNTQLFEAGMVSRPEKGQTARKIYKPILDRKLENWLLEQNMEIMIKALTGVA